MALIPRIHTKEYLDSIISIHIEQNLEQPGAIGPVVIKAKGHEDYYELTQREIHLIAMFITDSRMENFEESDVEKNGKSQKT